jgi:hypothetical protein
VVGRENSQPQDTGLFIRSISNKSWYNNFLTTWLSFTDYVITSDVCLQPSDVALARTVVDF